MSKVWKSFDSKELKFLAEKGNFPNREGFRINEIIKEDENCQIIMRDHRCISIHFVRVFRACALSL